VTEPAAWRVLARSVILVFTLLFLVFLIRELKTVVLQLLFAVLLAAAASPVVDAITTNERVQRGRFRPPRALVTIFVFLIVVLLLVLGGMLIANTVSPDLRRLATNLPQFVQQSEARINEMLHDPDIATRLPAGVEIPQLQDLMRYATGLASQAPQLLRVATGAFGGVFQAIFALILAIYLTADGERIRRYLVQLLPFDRQPQALRITERIGMRLGAWARGEVLLGVIIGTMTWLAALAIGLPYAGALGLIAGVGELIPNLGPIIAAVPFAAVGFLSSPQQGLMALAAAVLIQQLENHFIVPRVMGHAVELHPVVVMVAILAGNELLGITGALLAVPVAASLAVVIDELQQEHLTQHAIDTGEQLPPALAERVARGPDV
jgi:predicted PurR-regulated permease PerM